MFFSRRSFICLITLPLWQSWLAALAGAAPQSFFPPAVPLAVRSPTFSCWLDMRAGGNPMTTWPQFWNDQHILGWAGYIKVDSVAWHWLGSPVPGNASTWLSTTITPTRTILTVQAGPVQLNVTFLSPVEPTDWVRQSMPFSYVYLDGASTDNKAHSIQVYADISAEWVTNSFDTAITWATKQTTNSVFHRVAPTNPTSVFTDVPEDAIAFHAIATQSNLQSVIGTDQTLRPQVAAATTGITLQSDLSTSTGNVDSGGKFPVFAHAVDLGTTETISNVAWAVGVVREPVITYSGTQRHLYFWSQYSTLDDAIDAFISDFPSARIRAENLDQKILQDASAVSQEYADLISLATRQAMAGVELTVSVGSNGLYNTSDVLAFMKDVGTSQRVNPTETILAATPALMYLNASFLGPLLEPLLIFESSGAYGNAYAAPDIGTVYPAAPGNPASNDVYGVEDCGNMLILVLAHARSTGDGTLISRYYTLLKKWGDYLGTNALVPATQTSADARDPSLAQNHGNSTNLAIKGIIAIQAMAEISHLAGETTDAQQYDSTSRTLLQSWVILAAPSAGQLLWNYGDSSSFGLMYNILADKLLGLNFLPASVYQNAPSGFESPGSAFGFPLSDDSNLNTRSDWSLFSAAAAPNASTRDLLISGVHKRASFNGTSNTGTFATLYNAQTGAGIDPKTSPNGFGSPAQGAMFSVLSLNVPNKTVVVPAQASGGGNAAPATTGAASSNSKSETGAIAGGIIAGVFVLAVLGLTAFFLRRRRQRQQANSAPAVLTPPRPYHQPSFVAESFGVTSPTATSGITSVDSQSARLGSDARTMPVVPPFSGTVIGAGRGRETKAALAGARPLPPEPLSPTFSQPMSSQAPSVSGTSSSGAGTEQLRHEMENLRREVAQLRENQAMNDAPPVYE